MNNRQHWIYLRYILIAVAVVLPFALFQFAYVFKLSFFNTPARMFGIPIVVGIVFGILLAKIKILQRLSENQLEQLITKDASLEQLNQNLEAKVEQRTHELMLNQELTRNILDSQVNIVVLTDGSMMRDVNQAFFSFFSEYSNLEDFIRDHTCICDFFVSGNYHNETYLAPYMNNEIWVSYIATRPLIHHKARIQRHGRDYIFDVKVKASKLKDNKQLYVATFTDITDIMVYKNQLEATTKVLQAELFTDHMTGLPNRARLMNDLDEEPLSMLILLDIDGFREINDFFGHNSGDELLCALADFIKPHIQVAKCKLYRLAADEYAIASQQPFSEGRLVDFCRELHQLLENHVFASNGSEIMLGVTFGLSLHPPLEKSRLLAAAALALKTAKRSRKPWLVYNSSIEMHHIYARNLEEARLIKKAIQEHKVCAHFQPILNNKTRSIEKYECLARLIDDDEQVVLPGRFINAAKTTKLYHHITRIMLEQALEKITQTSYQFSLNLSTDDILDHETIQFILSCIKNYHAGDQLVIELLESEGIENFTEVIEFIHQAKDLNCRIAVDDFGSGYSNFDYLLKLDVDYLKIDASLVRYLDRDENARLIVSTIQNFAHQLGIATIAEHVHSKAVLDSVIDIGIDYSQGFLIGKPERDLCQDPSTSFLQAVRNGN
jgi:diguanylate cyclase (GGDEF)-like protein